MTLALIIWLRQNHTEAGSCAEDRKPGSIIEEIIPYIDIEDFEKNKYQSFSSNHRTVPCSTVKIWFTTMRISSRHVRTIQGSKLGPNVRKLWTWFINSTNTSTKAVARARPGRIRRMGSIMFSRAINDTERVSDRTFGTKMSTQSMRMRRRHAMTRVTAGFTAGTAEGLAPTSEPGIMSESLRTKRPEHK